MPLLVRAIRYQWQQTRRYLDYVLLPRLLGGKFLHNLGQAFEPRAVMVNSTCHISTQNADTHFQRPISSSEKMLLLNWLCVVCWAIGIYGQVRYCPRLGQCVDMIAHQNIRPFGYFVSLRNMDLTVRRVRKQTENTEQTN